mgnify:CR=1 FL=1|jgi:hypothetical protein
MGVEEGDGVSPRLFPFSFNNLADGIAVFHPALRSAVLNFY